MCAPSVEFRSGTGTAAGAATAVVFAAGVAGAAGAAVAAVGAVGVPAAAAGCPAAPWAPPVWAEACCAPPGGPHAGPRQGGLPWVNFLPWLTPSTAPKAAAASGPAWSCAAEAARQSSSTHVIEVQLDLRAVIDLQRSVL